ncbi:hypothetical protein BOQ23_06430 [Listeria monocytogenes]|nr:hypothetical protein [Listeria monocytogenes]
MFYASQSVSLLLLFTQSFEIGSSSAARFIAEVGDIRRFSTSRELSAYTGIDIRRYHFGKTFS